MYKLYSARQTGGAASEAALNEVDASYEIVAVDLVKGEQHSPTYRQINPREQVPSLQLSDGTIITEGIAILMHLADTHPDANLAPPCGTVDRAQVNRWLSMFATNVYEGENRRVFPERYTADPRGAQGVADQAKTHIARQYEVFEGFLGQGPYFRGKQFSIVDIYVWMLLQWFGDFEHLKQTWPKLLRLVETTMERPKIKPVHLSHFGPGLGLN